MKKFITQTIAFLVPLLIIVAVLEATIRHIPNDYRFKNTQIQLDKESIKTIILGSSHSMYGFNPDYFSDKAYNLGHVSQTIDLDYYLLKKYIEELPQLETVVLRLSYTTLHEQIETGLESWRLKDYNLYYDLHISNKLKYKSEVLSVKLKNNVARIKDYYLDNTNMITVENTGWASFDEPHANKSIDVLGPIAAKRHTADDDALVIENINHLENIVKLCNEKGIALLLITLPAHQSYVAHLDQYQLELVISSGEKMKSKYDNCIYLNLLEDPNFNDVDFYDADHPNANGAKKLSILVDDLISKPLN